MCAMGFTEAFIELFNINAAITIISFSGYILFKMHKIDKDVLKARLFLDNTIMHQTWIYLSIAGISIALNDLIQLIRKFTGIGDISYSYYIVGLIQIISLIAFTLLIYSWYLFISSNGQNYGVKGYISNGIIE